LSITEPPGEKGLTTPMASWKSCITRDPTHGPDVALVDAVAEAHARDNREHGAIQVCL
jgi:hypothetical protein